jgi:hypothetical protein
MYEKTNLSRTMLKRNLEMKTTDYDYEYHLQLLNKYKNDYGLCPFGTINISHLRCYISNAIKLHYLDTSTVSLVDMTEYSDLLNQDYYQGNHWENAINSHFELLRNHFYDLTDETEIDRFVHDWFKLICNHWNDYTLRILRKTLDVCFDSYEDDLSSEDSIEEFASNFRADLLAAFNLEKIIHIDD